MFGTSSSCYIPSPSAIAAKSVMSGSRLRATSRCRVFTTAGRKGTEVDGDMLAALASCFEDITALVHGLVQEGKTFQMSGKLALQHTSFRCCQSRSSHHISGLRSSRTAHTSFTKAGIAPLSLPPSQSSAIQLWPGEAKWALLIGTLPPNRSTDGLVEDGGFSASSLPSSSKTSVVSVLPSSHFLFLYILCRLAVANCMRHTHEGGI